MVDIDAEWMNYLKDTNEPPSKPLPAIHKDPSADNLVPLCEDLYISTKTKVLFLNQEINIHEIFWKIPIVEYWRPANGVVKKQIKIVSKTPEEYEEYKLKLVNNI